MTIAEIIATALIKYGPALARALADIFYKETVSREDWEKVFVLTETPYEEYTKPTPS